MGLICPWDSSSKKTGVGCHILLQGIITIQGLNPGLLCLLHCRQTSLAEPSGKPMCVCVCVCVGIQGGGPRTHPQRWQGMHTYPCTATHTYMHAHPFIIKIMELLLLKIIDGFWRLKEILKFIWKNHLECFSPSTSNIESYYSSFPVSNDFNAHTDQPDSVWKESSCTRAWISGGEGHWMPVTNTQQNVSISYLWILG